ncbi:hypothetical protein [Flavobacterium sp. W21_SRS_FM6]
MRQDHIQLQRSSAIVVDELVAEQTVNNDELTQALQGLPADE